MFASVFVTYDTSDLEGIASDKDEQPNLIEAYEWTPVASLSDCFKNLGWHNDVTDKK